MNTFRSLAAMGLLITASSGAHAASVLADWTFENTAPTTAGPFAAEIGSGSATGHHAGSTTYSSPAGNGSAHSFSSNGWASGDYYQFSVSTLGVSGLSLSWDQISSGTGPKDFQLFYSTDGSSFTSAGAAYSVLANTSPNVWSSGTPISTSSFSQDLSAIGALNNQATVLFRLVNTDTVSAAGGTTASAGTDRVDNFVVSASASTPVPLPAAIWLFGTGLAAIAGARRRRSTAAS